MDCVNDSVVLLRQARASGQRERDAALLGLVGEGPPAIEDPRNLTLAAGQLREVNAARHVAVFGRPPPQVLRRTGSW